MTEKELKDAVKKALFDYDFVDETEATRLANELFDEENEELLKNFLEVLSKLKSDLIKSITASKRRNDEIKEIVRDLSKLKEKIDDEEFLLSVAKKYQK